jgi:hypothetical protein|tara:strand:- start:206 stop:730 length:525 start_codon:yes stop_codon:yes gene_type:complete
MITSSTGYASSRIAIPIDPNVWAAEWFTEVHSMLYGAGPGSWKMDEKAYWEAMRSYTVEVFSWCEPDELKALLAVVEFERGWVELRKYFEARPDAKEAAGYRMLDDARRRRLMDRAAIDKQMAAGQIDRDERRALREQANSRVDAVVAIADAAIPGGRHALTRLVDNLLPEQLV